MLLHFIAQATQPGATTPEAPPWWANPQTMLYGVLAIGMIFIFTSSGRANRQDTKRHKELLANLKRGDRVQTIGGIIGSVVEARDTEIVIKVDESTNTKIRVVRDAIKRVVTEESETTAK
jgi:preprotein translocase subunit YajC